MKCNWRRWLWGVIPVVILTWAALQAERPRIEQELTEAASAQMLRNGASWARVTFEGRDGVLAGKAWDEADAAAALDLLRKQTGQVEKTHELRTMRKDIARLETIANQKKKAPVAA